MQPERHGARGGLQPETSLQRRPEGCVSVGQVKVGDKDRVEHSRKMQLHFEHLSKPGASKS